MTASTADRLTAATLPSPEEEEWRYSRISDLDLRSFAGTPARPAAGGVPEVLEPVVDTLRDRAGLVVVRNGYVTQVELDPALERRGVRVEARRGERAPEPRDVFGELHAELAPEALVIDVPAGVAVEQPVVVLNWVDDAGVTCFPHVVVRTGATAEVTVVDWQASPDAHALVVPVVDLRAGDASNLRYLNVQDLGRSVWQVGSQRVEVGQDANASVSIVALGGDYARVRTDAVLDRRAGTATLAAVYFGDGSQMHDFRTLQDHTAPRTTSHLLFKGAVADDAHGVYTGLIRVREGAKQSDSFLANRNLVLSETARVDSVPNLEIINENDLRNCGHASATGPIDEDHRFYLESRGVPSHVAEHLIVLGFFDDVIARTPVAALRPLLRAAVARKLGSL